MTELLSYDREGALERLIPLLREIGRGDAADDLVKREEKAYCTESDTCKVSRNRLQDCMVSEAMVSPASHQIKESQELRITGRNRGYHSASAKPYCRLWLHIVVR